MNWRRTSLCGVVLAVLLVTLVSQGAHAQETSENLLVTKSFRAEDPFQFDFVFKGRLAKSTRFSFEIKVVNIWDRDVINIVVKDTVPDLFGVLEYEADIGFVTITLAGDREKGGLGPDFVTWEIPFLTPGQEATLIVTTETLKYINMTVMQLRGERVLEAVKEGHPEAGEVTEAAVKYAAIYLNEGAVAEAVDPITGTAFSAPRTSTLRILVSENVFGGLIDRDGEGGGAGASFPEVTPVLP